MSSSEVNMGKSTRSGSREDNGAEWNDYEQLFLEGLVRTGSAESISEKWRTNVECQRRENVENTRKDQEISCESVKMCTREERRIILS